MDIEVAANAEALEGVAEYHVAVATRGLPGFKLRMGFARHRLSAGPPLSTSPHGVLRGDLVGRHMADCNMRRTRTAANHGQQTWLYKTTA
jgi:hypothetical protein